MLSHGRANFDKHGAHTARIYGEERSGLCDLELRTLRQPVEVVTEKKTPAAVKLVDDSEKRGQERLQTKAAGKGAMSQYQLNPGSETLPARTLIHEGKGVENVPM